MSVPTKKISPYSVTHEKNLYRVGINNKELNLFITASMKILLDKGVVFFDANPPKRTSDVIQYMDGFGGGKTYGFHTQLNIETGMLNIALRLEDFKDRNEMSEAHEYMLMRSEIEKITKLFDNVSLSVSH